MRKTGFLAGGALAAALVIAGPAAAEVTNVNVAFGSGLPHLPNYVVMEKKLLEKHTAEAGLEPAPLNHVRATMGRDLLLTGDAQIISGGGTTMLSIWDKTDGEQAVKGIVAISDMDSVLYTTDPEIQTIHDYDENDRVAVTGVGVSMYSIALQIAAQKEFGPDQRDKFDKISVQLANPDGLAMVLGGQSEVRSQMAPEPFASMALEGGAREVMRSSAYLGKANGIVLYTNHRFKTENPKVYDAIVKAYEEAMEIINNNPREAAEIYMKYEKVNQPVEWIEKVLTNGMITYTTTPSGFKQYADFWKETGRLTKNYDTWKDFFWENAHDKNGS